MVKSSTNTDGKPSIRTTAQISPSKISPSKKSPLQDDDVRVEMVQEQVKHEQEVQVAVEEEVNDEEETYHVINQSEITKSELSQKELIEIKDFQEFVKYQKEIESLEDAQGPLFDTKKAQLMELAKRCDKAWSKYIKDSVAQIKQRKTELEKKTIEAAKISKSHLGDNIMELEAFNALKDIPDWRPIRKDFRLEDKEAVGSATYGWYFTFDPLGTCQLSRKRVQTLLSSMQNRDLYILLKSRLLDSFADIIKDYNANELPPNETEIHGITPKLFHDNLMYCIQFLIKRGSKHIFKKGKNAILPVGLEVARTRAGDDLEREIFKWKSRSSVFEWDFLLLGFIIFVELLLVSVLVWDANWLAKTIWTISLILTCAGLCFSTATSRKRVKRKLGKLKRITFILGAITWLGSVANFYLFRYYLNVDYSKYIRYGETMFPYLGRLACLLGFASLSFTTLSLQSRHSAVRDASLLEETKLITASDDSIDNARRLFQLISLYTRTKITDMYKFKWKIFIGRLFEHGIGSSILPISSLLSLFQEYNRFQFKSFWSDEYSINLELLNLWDQLRNIDPKFWVYFACICIGANVLFLTTFTFEIFLSSLKKKYDTSHTLLSMLLATTSPEESAMHNLPYTPLTKKRNIDAFLKISNFIRSHFLGSVLGEIVVGFAALLIVDVITIGIFLVLLYSKATPIPYRSIIGLGYYGVILTTWCFLILKSAAEVYTVHMETLKRLTNLSLTITLDGTKTDEDLEDLTNSLDKLKSTLEFTYEPLKVFGIQATPTLLQVFISYVASALLALIYKGIGIE